MTNRGYVQIDFHHKETGPLLFTNPIHIITTNHVDEVDRCLDEIGSWTEQGYFAAGFISYEADIRSFSVHKESGMPLVWFGIFSKAKAVPQSKRPKPYDVGHWETKTTKSKYMKDIETIHEHIRQGDTYQVNYTMQLESQFLGDAKSYYEDLKTKQQAAYSAYVDMGDGRKVVSVSPELFFSKTDNELMTKPMKGTIRRGETSSEDEQLKKTLVHSEKDRAENVMIVDLLRNDLGRIAKLGSVHVNDLFHIEQYPTVWQMTSVVACTMRPKVKFRELVRTLFPCGSITGAPKQETMKIIQDLEADPRGVYCGSIGYVTPTGDALFNVGIRTASIMNESIRYGAGGGVTIDSTAEGEYAEALLKTNVVEQVKSNFSLLESMLLKEGRYARLNEHLERLAESQMTFLRSLDEDNIKMALLEYAESLDHSTTYKVRLVVGPTGEWSISHHRIEHSGIRTVERVGWGTRPVHRGDLFLRHKTTLRSVYEERRLPNVFDVLLYNDENEVTEFTIGNVVAKVNGKYVTPPLESGCLPGVFRRHLLQQGTIEEQVLTVDDVSFADELWLINSVREWVKVRLS